MADSRIERQRTKRRLLLERAMLHLEAEEALQTGGVEQGLQSRGRGEAVEELFFHDHAECLEGLSELLETVGLAEACLSLARHQEEERDHWLRRLRWIEGDPRLREARRIRDEAFRALLMEHFQRWGAAGAAGARAAGYQAALVLAALREAEVRWVEGGGRPMLPVLVQEALGLLWPALYPHLRRHPSRAR